MTVSRILADDAPVLIWVAGPDGSEFVNLAYLEFVGVSREVDVLHFDWTSLSILTTVKGT